MKSATYKTLVFATLWIAAACTSCKKEKHEPTFHPEGYWRGNAYLLSMAILNHEDGTSRFYLRIPGNDTAAAELKLNGTYMVTSEGIKALYEYPNETDVLVETYTATAKSMTGLMTFTTGEAVTFDLRKQASQ